MATVEERIMAREATIAVLGLGYVGLPLAVEFAESGFGVTGVDLGVHNTPKVIGGTRPAATHLAKVLFEAASPSGVFEVSSPRAAEMAKLLENTFRAVNIALVNELALLAERMGVDIWEVIDAASTK